MFWKPKKRGQGGQSAVETAIVMPLNVFIILAIIQQGLIVQARIMTKYAAYRAVRVGSMNNARTDMMTHAALFTLLPVYSLPALTGGSSVFPNMKDTASAATQLGGAFALNAIGTIFSPVKVTVCGPLAADVTGITQSTFGPTGDANEVDFDDPRASTEWMSGTPNSAAGFKSFMATKLRIQVKFMYPMIIPFANSIISLAYLGINTLDFVGMQEGINLAVPNLQALELAAAAKRGMFLAPINASYAMRMQSNFFLNQDGAKLPTENACIHYSPTSS